MRKILLKLHLVGTLVFGIFVVILGISGSIMAFEKSLDRWFNRGFYDIAPQLRSPQPLAKLAAAVQRRFSGGEVEAIAIPERRDTAHVALLDSGVAVAVNGYTGAIVGTVRGRGFLALNHEFHTRLLAGRIGAAIVTLSGIVALFLVISGIVLWWRAKRFTVRWNAPLFRVMFDLHNAAGITAAVFLLFLTTTGVVLAFDGPVASMLFKVTGTKPVPRTRPSVPQAGVRPIDADQAVSIAEKAEPGATPLLVELPAAPTESYNIHLHYPEDRTPIGRSWVCIDQYSGKVLTASATRTAPLPLRALLATRQIHTGDIYGTPSRIVMSAASLVIVLQALSGVVMWLKRDRRR